MSIQDGSIPIRIRRSFGDFLEREDGSTIIDAISSWWTCIHGHCHPEIMNAIRSQTEKLDHVIFAGFSHNPAEELADLVLESTGRQFHKVFFSDNGSNAVEIAVKLALQFFRNRNASFFGQSKEYPDKNRKNFVRFSLSYHGDSIGAMSLGGESVFTRIFRDLAFPTREFPTPNCTHCPWGKKPSHCQTECLGDFSRYLETSGGETVAVVLEPLVSGANGMIFHSEKFLVRLRELTKSYGILMVFDEVFTGLFRTGEWYAFTRAEVLPDLVCLAKGLTGGTLPLALTLVSEEIYREFDSPDPEKGFFHGHTMAGNPIACAGAVASLKILFREGRSQVENLNRRLVAGAESLQNALGDRIRDMRVMGSILAFEVNQDLGADEYLNPIGRRIRDLCIEAGVLIRPLGNTVYLTPPYNISSENLEKVFFVLEKVLLREWEKEFTISKS